MKIDEISQKYNIDKESFKSYLIEYGKINLDVLKKHNITLDNMNIADERVIDHISSFKRYIEKQKALAEGEAERQSALSNMLITSGFNFDGYRIVKYSGYISGDDAISVDRGNVFVATDVAQSLTDSLVKIRRRALQELKEAAYDLGCNAVIGVDFDYITLDPETANITGGTTYLPYVFCVTANGNAVVIEKDDSK